MAYPSDYDVTANTLLLIKSEGGDGSTVFVDSTGNNAISTTSNAQHSNIETKFSTTSLQLIENSLDEQSFISFTEDVSFTFPTAEFTVDAWVKNLVEVGSVNPSFVVHSMDGLADQTHWSMFINPDGKVGFRGGSTSTSYEISLLSTESIYGTDFRHCAVTGDGTTVRLFIDGVIVDSTLYSGVVLGGGSRIAMGAILTAEPSDMYLDAVRVSNVPLWTVTFAPPGEPPLSSGDPREIAANTIISNAIEINSALRIN